MFLNSALIWYQRKIGTYDSQMWEKTVEQRILRGLGNVPKKTARLKTELIDLDLVRGSTFPKAKPHYGAAVAAQRGIVRVLFLPLYFNWWKRQTNIWVSSLLLIIYILQFCNTFTYFFHSISPKDGNLDNQECDFALQDISLVEILLPIILMIILGVMHSQVVATVLTSERRPCRAKQKRKRVKKKLSSKTASGTGSTERSSCSSFPFAFYFGDDSLGNTKASSTSHNMKPSKRETEKKIGRNDTSCEENRQNMNKCQASNGSLFKTSESSPQAAHIGSDDKSDVDTRNDSAVQDISSGDVETDLLPSDVEVNKNALLKQPRQVNFDTRRCLTRRRVPRSITFSQNGRQNDSSCNSSCESEADTTSPNTPLKEQTCDGDWVMTTNTEGDNSYSSNMETDEGLVNEDPFGWKLQNNSVATVPAPTLPTSDKVSCTIWEGKQVHKVDFSVLDICSVIIQRVDNTTIGTDYLVAGLGFATMVAFLPAALRIHDTLTTQSEELHTNGNSTTDFVVTLMFLGIGTTLKTRAVVLAAKLNNFCLSMLFFFLLSVAERTFKQRFLYAKLFSHLTSSRRARKSDIPHFRLNKVGNIKTWLSVRSYLKRHGPQRSVDVIVSAAFMLAFIVICFLCFQLMKDSENFGHALLHWELVVWTLALGVYLLRFMTLGTKINKKYGNPSVLITEQINLYLQMEQKPHKKEGLSLANNVLKLAADLLKELESPFKISGLSANPYLYNITKLVILSAFSAVIKEVLGFKLKLYKIKI
uniref:PHTF1/2 N-terminal domain-containing protein n=1 Tax=Strigamia maritima TaxID=126957 RepID=T1ITP0_STRMM